MRLATPPLLLTLSLFLTLSGCKAAPSGGDGASAAVSGAEATAAKAEAGTAKADEKAKPAADEKKPETGRNAKGEGEEKSEADKLKEKEEKEKKEKEAKIKKYEETLEEKTKTVGFFTTYHKDGTLLLELDEKSFGREFLYQGALNSGVGTGSLYRGAMLFDNPFVLHFEKRNSKHIVLVAENTRWLEPGDSFDHRRLKESTTPSVLQTFSFAAEHPDEGKYLIDLGSWFLADNLQLARRMSGKYTPSKDLSLFTKVDAFPRNLEVGLEMVMTGSRTGGNLTLADSRSMTLLVRHSFTALPSPGYKPRDFDQRVGYFLEERKDLFDIESKDPVHRYINRWRLQKKDPTAEVSDPVEPIVYWVENSTPKKWRDAVKRGIEAWEPAYRKAGFSNGIVAKVQPADADWDPADVRFATVRWSTDDNVSFAIGPSRTDPRTGEIIDADITLQESFLASYGRRFDTYVSDLAKMEKPELRALAEKQFDTAEPENFDDMTRLCHMMSEERMNEVSRAAAISSILQNDFDKDAFLNAMLVDLVMHEVGHTLGLRHNFKSSTWIPSDRQHDAVYTAQNGLAGSVMDYNAINLAAPGTPQGEYFPSRVGPYDMWAIEYGYTEFGGNEAPGLKAIASRSHLPGHEYGTDEDQILGDPLTRTWDFGGDPVQFAADQIALAEEGFRRLTDKGAEQGEAYYEYARFYSMFSGMFARYTGMLSSYLGGYSMNRDLVGQGGGRQPIVPLDAAMQKRALNLAIDKGLGWTGGIPDNQRLLLANKKHGSWGSWFDFWSFDPIPRIVNATRYGVLVPLMSVSMFERVGNQQRLGGTGPGTHEIANRVFDAVWKDHPDEHDRWVQKDYVELIFVNLKRDTTPDITALMDNLLTRSQERANAYASSGDELVRVHGEWLAGRIDRYRQRQITESY